MPSRNYYRRPQSLEASGIIMPLRQTFPSSISVDRYSEYSLHADYQTEKISSELHKI